MNPVIEYRNHCANFISFAIKHPQLVYRNLQDLYGILYGHWYAFYQLHNLETPDSFNICFSKWIWETHEMSCSDDCFKGVERLAKQKNVDSETLFVELVEEFLSIWLDSPDGIMYPDEEK